MTVTDLTARPHPAKFSEPILATLNAILGREAESREQRLKVLDPFAGIGSIHALDRNSVYRTVGVELEPEWAMQHPRNVVGDATHLSFADNTFDAVVTSPCYGNRMADTYDGRDGSKRVTYRIHLGRMPTEGSAATMQWGEDYQRLHHAAWREAMRVVRPGGLLVVNVSDHIRGGQRVKVSEWHGNTIEWMGWVIEDWMTVDTRRMRMGSDNSRDLRVTGEEIIVARKPYTSAAIRGLTKGKR